jgi:hypothetical protein
MHITLMANVFPPCMRGSTLPAVLCREEAIHLWNERAQFEALGVKLVCVLHEWKLREVEGFAPEYFGGPVYFDEAKAFYATVHGGQVKRGNVLDLINPWGRAWANMQRARASGTVKDSNLTGDGLTLGGLLLIGQDGQVAYSFAEKTFGDHAPFEEVLAACKKVVGK